MTLSELRQLLKDRSDADFVEREILERLHPWVFPTEDAYHTWQEAVASTLALRPDCIRIVGSAATGYSLSPLKPGRPFRPLSAGPCQASDIDIAVIAPKLFDLAWETILSADRKRRLHLAPSNRERMRLDVYWGLVSQRSVPENTGTARSILMAMAAAGRLPPVRGYDIRCRIYRRLDDLRAYHIDSLRHLRTELRNLEETQRDE